MDESPFNKLPSLSPYERGRDKVKGEGISKNPLFAETGLWPLTINWGADTISTMTISSEILYLINEIKKDKTRGAAELARQAVKVLKIAAGHSQVDSVERFIAEQREIGERLMSVRPAMAPVFNIVNRFLGALTKKAGEKDLDSLKNFAISKSDELINNSLRAAAQIAQFASELLNDGDIIMTHSYSSTVMEALKVAFNKHGNIEVITTRSGPGRTGERIARELAHSGVPVTFIDDTAIGVYILVTNKVVVGADRICSDGKLVNGIGTYQLALAAAKADIPFYVLCEKLKFDPRLRGNEVDLEEKEPSEVVESGVLPMAVEVKNPYFDITPLELITSIITENGLLAPEEVIGYIKTLVVGK